MKKDIYIFTRNHAYNYGIVEILYSIQSAMNKRFDIKYSNKLRAGECNIIIDEFTIPSFIDYMRKTKQESARTSYIVVATEFVTRIRLLGLDFSRTFNFFGDRQEWKQLFRMAVKWVLRPGSPPSYMHQRFLGFAEALQLCDGVALIHEGILRGLGSLLPDRNSPPRVVAIYPEIRLAPTARGDLENLPFGFVLTGTLTPYRENIARNLERKLRAARYYAATVTRQPFTASGELVLKGENIVFDYESAPGKCLFNLNPPLRAHWPFSSPMRILRTTLLRQIPVVTRKYGDHEIEDLALLWDGRLDTAQDLLRLGLWEREALIEKHLALIERYNKIARAKNAECLSLLCALRS